MALRCRLYLSAVHACARHMKLPRSLQAIMCYLSLTVVSPRLIKCVGNLRSVRRMASAYALAIAEGPAIV